MNGLFALVVPFRNAVQSFQPNKYKAVAKFGGVVISCLYPLLVLSLSKSFSTLTLILIMVGFLFAQRLLKIGMVSLKMLIFFTLFAAVIFILKKDEIVLRSYPFLMSSVAFFTFLKAGQNPILRYGLEGQVTKKWFTTGAEKARKIWVVGLALNSLVLFVLMFAFERRVWAYYAGGLSYLWLGFLFICTVFVIVWQQFFHWRQVFVGNAAHYLLRILAYICGFSMFGLLCAISLPITLPLALLPERLRAFVRPLSSYVVYLVFRFFRFYCKYFYFVDMKIEGYSNKIEGYNDKTAPKLFVCNHVSMFDVVLLFSYFPRIISLVKSDFSKNPFLWSIVRICGYPAVTTGKSEDTAIVYRRMKETLLSGCSVCVFPEGTRSRDGELGRLKNGVFVLAEDIQKAITPIFFSASQPFLNGRIIFPRLAGKVTLTAKFYPPISADSAASLKEKFLSLYQSETPPYEQKIFDGTHPDFEGHFPGFPVFPAVSQIDLVISKIGQLLGKPVELRLLKRSKFRATLRPGEKAVLSVVLNDDSAKHPVASGAGGASNIGGNGASGVARWRLQSIGALGTEPTLFSEGALEFAIAEKPQLNTTDNNLGLGVFSALCIFGNGAAFSSFFGKVLSIESMVAIAVCYPTLVILGLLVPQLGIFARPLTKVPTHRPFLALTFDDGPDEVSTPVVLDLLDAHDAKATFFLIGEKVDKYPKLVKQIVDRGHQVESHSYHHTLTTPVLWADTLERQLSRTRESIFNASGVQSKFVRPPFGLITPPVRDAAKKLGLNLCCWSSSARDGGPFRSTSRSLRKLTKGLIPGNILVLHDANWKQDAKANAEPIASKILEYLLPLMKNRNLKSVTINELLSSQVSK